VKIQQFDGGLSTRTEPQFLSTNQGTVYENIDNASGILKPLKMPAPAGIFVKPFHTFFDHNQEWVDSDVRRDFVEFQRKLYWTDRITAPQKYDGTTQANLGIVPPPQLVNITALAPPTVVSVDAVHAVVVSGSDIPFHDLFYAIVEQVPGGVTSALALQIVTQSTDVESTNSIGQTTTTNYTTGSSVVLGENLDVDELSTEEASLTPTALATLQTVTFSSFTVNGAIRSVYRLFEGTYRLVGTFIPGSPGTSLLDDVYDISANAELVQGIMSPLLGVYQYQMTYYNSADGTESGPSLFSAEIDLDKRSQVTLTNLPVSTDPQVDERRLYRVGGNLTTSTLVTELDNIVTVYVDDTADTDLTGQLLSSSIAFNPPIGLAFLTTAYAMLFGAEGSKLRFTPIGDPNSWPELHFLEFDLDITGIAAVSNGILVFTKYETNLVTGTGPNALSKQRLSADQGCLAFESIQVMGGAALWVSTDGICTSGGGPVMVVSKQTLGKYSVDATASAVFDESYYVLDSGGTVTQFDFAYGKIYKTQTPGVASLAIANDVLYGVKEGELQQFYAGADATMKYKSPRFIEGSVTEQKWYKKFTVYHEGDIIITVLIDNILVATHTLSGTDSTEIQVPADKQRGHFVQFEIEGTGTIHEIEYAAGRAR